MQLKAFLKMHLLTVTEVAARWGVVRPVLQRAVQGQRWPNAKILVKAHQLSGGKVTLADWIETCRPMLIADGIITESSDDGATAQTSELSDVDGGQEVHADPSPGFTPRVRHRRQQFHTDG